MNVWATLPDKGGCGHYRVMYPGLAAAREEGVAIEFRERTHMYVDDDDNVGAVDVPTELDVYVMSRPLRKHNCQAIPLIQGEGIAVVVDIDDDLSCVDPRHYSWRNFEPKFSPDSNKEWLRKACSMADVITCSTPALAQRYGHGRAFVLPNRIPKAMLGVVPERPRDGRTIGWSGYVEMHPLDLPATNGGVAAAMQDRDLRFEHIGTSRMLASGLNAVQYQLELEEDQEFLEVGSKPFGDYAHALAQLDVGIVPLHDTKFNAAKSALKGLEMAAVGVPFVASPVADYQRVAADGIGVLAGSRKKWRREIKHVLDDREELSAQMRTAVIEKHLIEGNGWRWAEAWQQAIVNRSLRARKKKPISA